jgi:dipeptidyl aminopeptidase/acylaminoacyl peptidase
MHLTTCFARFAPRPSFALRASLLLVAGALAGPAGSAAADAAPPSAQVFGALPESSSVVMTPNGQRLAWIDERFATPRVVMFDIAARKDLRVLQLPERLKVRRILWNDDDTLIITFSETQNAQAATQLSREYFINIAYDASGGEGRLLPAASARTNDGRTDAPLGSHLPRRASGSTNQAAMAAAAYLVRTRPSKPHTVIMATHACDRGMGCLLEVDTATGTATVIRSGNEYTGSWVVNRDGMPVARQDWDWKTRAYHVYAFSGESVREILRRDDNQPPTLAGILADNSALVLLTPNGRSRQAAWALPLDGSPLRLLAEDPVADITGAVTDSYTGAIIGFYASGTKTRIDWLDPEARHRAELVEHAFPNRTVDVYGWSADGSRTLAEVQSPSLPPMFYLIDFSTHRADIAAEAYPALADVALGEWKEISYKARDGTPIPAYLTLPAGKHTGAVPLVVYPHGGPNERDYPNFDWFVQFLATRGYAVLQPQFRGSAGFGEAFQKAGYRQWGGLMQDDVTDGVQAMIEQGIADPHHVGIVGMSYGGYAALAGAAFTPTLYSCAASVNGVSDLRALMEEEVPRYGNFVRFISASQSEFTERIGAETDPALKTKSPINSVASIRTPILIAYGTGDARVPTEQSERMAEALRKAGKSVTVVKLPDEDHWLSRTETRVQLLQAVDGFLHEHL